MKIGIIGTGNMATILGELWQHVGHEVLYGARNPAEVTGRNAGTVAQAAAFGEVIVMAVNYWTIGDALTAMGDVTGKLIVDISNPFVLKAGAADKHHPANFERAVQPQPTALLRNMELAPQAVWVKAFCSLPGKLVNELHHQMPRIAIGYTADSEGRGATTAALITDAGFDPVYVGGAEQAAQIELGGKLSMQPMTREQMIVRI
jgi:predicted dinucleotide-binding enzyme